jgi:hypothetical protein
MKLGTIDTNYSNFTSGHPTGDAFDIPGIDKCMVGDDGECPNENVHQHLQRWLLTQSTTVVTTQADE